MKPSLGEVRSSRSAYFTLVLRPCQVFPGSDDFPGDKLVEVPGQRVSRKASTDIWCRIVARGQIVEKWHDGCHDRQLRVSVTLVEHPDLPADELYAVFLMGCSATTYRGSRPNILTVASSHGAFNWV